MVVLASYGAYMIPVWTGILQELDPSGKTPFILQWFLGIITLVVLFLLTLVAIKVGEWLGEMIGL